MRARGIPQVDYVGVRSVRLAHDRAQVLEQIARLGLPVFVKPAHLGSSMGIVKVDVPAALTAALEQAFGYDELAIVEAMAGGIEVECGVLGELPGGAADDGAADGAALRVSEPGEVVFPGEWYDFSAKYSPGGMELRIPARVSALARRRLLALARTAFLAAGCEGLARVDFFVDGERVLLNELNTMPGFTPTSVYAKLLAASGVPYPELLDRLCRLALERHRRHQAIVT
jgi:D-alanine-D-alanine ligase